MSTKALNPVDSSFALCLTLIPSFQWLLPVPIPDYPLGSLSLPPIKAAISPRFLRYQLHHITLLKFLNLGSCRAY